MAAESFRIEVSRVTVYVGDTTPRHTRRLPGGAKGLGMLGTAGVQAAIANAVALATGRRVRHLPIRIEDIIGPAVAGH